MNDKIRYTLAFVLVVIIIAVGTYAYINKDSIFLNVVEMAYPDGCNETYKNGELITPVCEAGRLLVEKTQNNYPGQVYGDGDIWSPNITLIN